MLNSTVPGRAPAIRPRSGAFSAAVLLAAALASSALADFSTPYAPSAFTLTNSTFSNGSVDTSGAPASIVLTGPNDGSGQVGSTAYATTSRGNGTLHFRYSYSTLDAPNGDTGGYTINGIFVPLATHDGQSGVVNVPIHLNDTFGFRVDSVDNIGEPGILTISDFSAPGTATVPTTSLPASIGLGLLLCLLSLRLIRRSIAA